MYTIVQVGSLQYKVAAGDTIEVDRFDAQEGKSINLDKVLFYSDGKDVRIGQPFLKDVKVTAKVLGETLGEKKISFKYSRRKDWSWKKGHRAQLTSLNITKISV